MAELAQDGINGCSKVLEWKFVCDLICTILCTKGRF